MPPGARPGRDRRLPLAALVAGVVVLAVLAVVVPAAVAYLGVDRVDLDSSRFGPSPDRQDPTRLPVPSPGDEERLQVEDLPSLERRVTVLLIGSDSRAGLEDLRHFGQFEGRRADVVMLLVAEPGREPTILSVPRDLWVEIPCGGSARINEALEGCGRPGDGPSVLAAAVEELTGIGVDHYVEVDLAGFPPLIDLLGGVELCLDHPTRDFLSGLHLPSGCTVADGEQTLAWVRSRQTEEQVDGRWRPVEGVNDLERNARQRDLLVSLFGKVAGMRSPVEIVRLATTASRYLTVDRSLDLVRAAGLVWSMRSLEPSRIRSLSVPVTDERRGEAEVLVPTEEVAAWFSEELEAAAVTPSGS